ncbi:hypothetical protein QBC41DRAFT_341554 [Cercophora samala]|uniref:Uncharacterized protein n=1 Tax=Cercophora samala TaxID=330535 RepID=A0AA39YTR9_9PEZI|nr:hypothetical protein QBC41DRAFT_341554 [Cercophora samala]
MNHPHHHSSDAPSPAVPSTTTSHPHRDIFALPGRNEFPAEFIFRLHRNDALEAPTGFLGFILIRTTSFHRLLERGFYLEPDHILHHLSKIYNDGDFLPDKWDKLANQAHPSLTCKRVWPIRNQAYRWGGEIRFYSDKEDKLASSSVDEVWAWTAVAEINAYIQWVEGGKIYNYVADWVRSPCDGRERENWCLVEGVRRKDLYKGWWGFGGVVYDEA